MTHISEALLELLMRDGITREGLAGPVARGIDAGLPGAQTDPLTAQPTGGEDREPMGILVKGTPTEIGAKFTGGGRHRFGQAEGAIVLEVHTNPNLSNMPKHGLAHAPRVAPLGASPCLRIIEGGKR